jgi:hypothetical protein
MKEIIFQRNKGRTVDKSALHMSEDEEVELSDDNEEKDDLQHLICTEPVHRDLQLLPWTKVVALSPDSNQ